MRKQNHSSETACSVTVDNVVFGLNGSDLNVLLVRQTDPRHRGRWALPGGWITQEENLSEAATRVLRDLTGLDNLYLEQLRAFGNVNRMPNERVITIAYYALISADDIQFISQRSAKEVAWHPVSKLPELVYDHAEIAKYGYEFIKKEMRHRPVGFELLPDKFTLLQLQSVYECILNSKLDKGNFRRKILNSRILLQCNERQTGVNHRAATLFKFDPNKYQELVNEGFSFVL